MPTESRRSPGSSQCALEDLGRTIRLLKLYQASGIGVQSTSRCEARKALPPYQNRAWRLRNLPADIPARPAWHDWSHLLAASRSTRCKGMAAGLAFSNSIWRSAAMQGVAYGGQGHEKDALASFQRALKISPDYLPALHGAIQIEFENASPAAIPLLQRVLSLRPGDETSHAMLAVLEYQRGDCVTAVPHFDKAGALLDSQRDALHAYATCLVKLKQPDRAAQVFQRALALSPDDRRERLLLASVQLMAHQPKDALATLTPLLDGNGNHADAETLELASKAYEDSKDTPQAVSTLRQAILLDPGNANLYLDFANLSFAHDSAQVGVNVVSDGIAMQPKAAPLYFARGVLYIQLAEYEKGQADFEKAYELDPSQSLSTAAQGLAAAQQNDLDRALANIQASLAQKPNDAILLYLQADLLSQKGAEPGTPDFQTAMRSARKAVALQPTLGAARGVLATLYLKTGTI